MDKKDRFTLMLTGLVGLCAAVLVGAGEFLLHFDVLARYSEEHYDFMLAASDSRQTLGHFIGVLSAPLYVIGCWHIYLMLKPAGQKLAFIAFLLASYGFFVGGVWIGSRSSIGAIMHLGDQAQELPGLFELYKLRYESLLWVIRTTTFLLSVIFIGLTLTGRSHYSKWMAVFNPITLLVLSFVVFVVSPEIGKYLMPIALNVGFGVFFLLSLLQVRNVQLIDNKNEDSKMRIQK